jgi:hypothetical protein
MQEMTIVVQFLSAFEGLQIAEHVTDYESEKNYSAHGHNGFLTVRRLPKASRTDFTRAYYSASHVGVPDNFRLRDL